MELISKIKIKPSFFVLAAFSLFMGLEEYFVMFFVLLLLHELCHIFTAGLWGLKTRGVTITPIGTAADIEGLDGLHIAKRVIIAAAGPAFNAALFFVCKAPLKQLNLVIALFNMLPVYPLDGGKIFHYTVSYFTGVLRGNILAARLSIALSFMTLAAGVLQLVLYPPNISLLCLGIYFYRLNKTGIINLTYDFYRSLINKNDNKLMPVRCISVSSKMPVKAVVYRLGWDYYTLVYIRDKNISLNEEQLLEYITTNGLRGTTAEVWARVCK